MVCCKSVVDSLPIYFLSIFRIPRKAVKKIKSILARFFWDGSDERLRGRHDISWGRVYKSKMGGLDFKYLIDFNMALLYKWLWKLGVGDSGLWAQFIRQRYYGSVRDWNMTPVS